MLASEERSLPVEKIERLPMLCGCHSNSISTGRRSRVKRLKETREMPVRPQDTAQTFGWQLEAYRFQVECLVWSRELEF